LGEDESYDLEISADGAKMHAATPLGTLHGLQTILQLVQVTPEGFALPAVSIQDQPRFPWRGLMIDSARHFIPLEVVKRNLDGMEAVKMNVFHWHLSENQGFRVESHKFPKLHEQGSDGRYYTQEEIRDLIAYARDRGIRVVPEFDMPGHNTAWFVGHPEIAAGSGPYQIERKWGVFDPAMDPTSEKTYKFLNEFLAEMTKLFPDQFFHIGGDEAPKKRWQESALAQEIIEREKLAGEDGLQSWFIRRIERFLNDNGRRLIGWDEILEGGLAPNATVMSWRGTAGGIAAARQGHDVVMSPQADLYFDHYQADPEGEPLAIGGSTPIEDTYGYEPVSPELTEAEAAHILGPQGCVWTEYMATSEHVEYMAYPRVLALAEIAWSPRDARDWTSFSERLPAALRFLDALGVHYRKP